MSRSTSSNGPLGRETCTVRIFAIVPSESILAHRTILPTTAERLDQMNAGGHSCIQRLRKRELIGQQRPLGVDDREIVDETASILNLGDAEIVLRRRDRLSQAFDVIGQRVQGGQRV